MQEKQFHLVYKTVHIPSGRYYIGVHSTDDLNDEYFGSGRILTRLLKAHPKSEFKRDVITTCRTREEAFDVEAMIVQPFLLDKKLFPNLLNTGPGGRGGYGRELTEEEKLERSIKISNGQKGKKRRPLSREHKDAISNGMQGVRFPNRKKMTDEHKRNLSIAAKRYKAQSSVVTL